jgi:hypothetical protein
MRIAVLLGLSSFVAVVAAAGCESPVEDAEIEAQGPEVEGLEEDEFHRYGQNCLACHGGYGPGPQWAFAGTVFATPNDDIPVQGAIVTMTDAAGQVFFRQTNCAGNFYIDAEVAEPVFPVHVEVECPIPGGDTTRRAVMGTRMNRDGGCAMCHDKGPATADSPGQVYCLPEQSDPPFEVPSDCPGGPAGTGTP